MIADNDRSGYFGASDTPYIIGNTETKSFEHWWLEKCGILRNTFTNDAMCAGTQYEHKILEHIGVENMDQQIIIEELKLRVNLDGDMDKVNYEVKTYRHDKGFKMPKKYVYQVNVQEFALKYKFGDWNSSKVVAYGLTDYDYRNYFNPIEDERLSFYPVEYDERWINNIYLPRLEYYAECLKKGVMPRCLKR